MSSHVRLLAPLLPLLLLASSIVKGQESSQVVFWEVATSSKAASLQEARVHHKNTAQRVHEWQSRLQLDQDDLLAGSLQMQRNMYRTIPKGYEFRQKFYLRQRDTSRFEEFFDALAPLDSEYQRINFRFRPVSWQPPIEAKPTIRWRITVVGGGKTLVESKRWFESQLSRVKSVLEKHKISSIKRGNPSMNTVPEQLQEYEKPEGYTFQQTLTFRQQNLDQFNALLDQVAEMDSDYLHAEFDVEVPEQR